MRSSKAGRGRPVGSVMTSKSILKQDLREAARVNKEMRELLSEQIGEIRKILKDIAPDDLEKRLKVVEILTVSLAGSAKAIESTAKHVVSEDEGGGEVEVDIRKELLG